MARDSRASMVRSAAALIGSRGVSATSFTDVLADSGAPRGSIYHHFPDGKAQLAEDAVRWTSDRVVGYLRDCPATTPVEVLACFTGLWRQVVVSSGGTAGCVVAGVTIDTAAGDPADRGLLDTARSTFRSWVDLLTARFVEVGVAADRARPIALATLAAMEGALILCRAEGDVAPLDTVAAELTRLLPADPG